MPGRALIDGHWPCAHHARASPSRKLHQLVTVAWSTALVSSSCCTQRGVSIDEARSYPVMIPPRPGRVLWMMQSASFPTRSRVKRLSIDALYFPTRTGGAVACVLSLPSRTCSNGLFNDAPLPNLHSLASCSGTQSHVHFPVHPAQDPVASLRAVCRPIGRALYATCMSRRPPSAQARCPPSASQQNADNACQHHPLLRGCTPTRHNKRRSPTRTGQSCSTTYTSRPTPRPSTRSLSSRTHRPCQTRAQ